MSVYPSSKFASLTYKGAKHFSLYNIVNIYYTYNTLNYTTPGTNHAPTVHVMWHTVYSTKTGGAHDLIS